MLGATDSPHNIILVMDRRFLWSKFYFLHFPLSLSFFFFWSLPMSVCCKAYSFVCGSQAVVHSLHKLQIKKMSLVSYKM
jgi:hypothetical protein